MRTMQEALCKKYGITNKDVQVYIDRRKKEFEKHGILKKFWKGIAMQELLKEKLKTIPTNELNEYQEKF